MIHLLEKETTRGNDEKQEGETDRKRRGAICYTEDVVEEESHPEGVFTPAARLLRSESVNEFYSSVS